MNKKKYQQPELEVLYVSENKLCVGSVGPNSLSNPNTDPNTVGTGTHSAPVHDLDLSDDESSDSPFSASYVD
jgi:hypothetical protein